MTIQNRHSAYSVLEKTFPLKRDVPLSRFTSFKVGGPADLLALPESQNDLVQLLNAAKQLEVPVTLIGGGTNLLVADNGIRGLVVVTRKLRSEITLTWNAYGNGIVQVDAGHLLSTLCRFAIFYSLSGLEFAAGIPGTVGGAVAMNAGTPSGQMSDTIQRLFMWNPDRQDIDSLHQADLDFTYRSLNTPGVIVAAELKLAKGERNTIEQLARQTIERKNATQPVSSVSAGCFFKNPPTGPSAGELIEKAGLKGSRINDAMVSLQHANYIINTGAATCRDILALKQKIQKTVSEKFHINLETEVRIEGE